MSSTEIQSKIQAAAARFTDEIVAIFGDALSAVASDLAVKAPTKAKPAAKKAAPVKRSPAKPTKPAQKAASAKKAPAKPARPGTRVRRSADQLVADGEKIVKLLGANKTGLRIEQINKSLGAATGQLARPILKLLADGKIKKTGQKRATMYFSA